jgi:hypothetical protein
MQHRNDKPQKTVDIYNISGVSLFKSIPKRFLCSMCYGVIVVVFMCWPLAYSSASEEARAIENTHSTDITDSQLNEIAQKIYQNETGSNPDYLIAWNEGENFASLGLGHFIWFPKGLDSPFTETFPELIEYLDEQGVNLPTWLQNNRDFPFNTKQAFVDAKDSEEMKSLKQLLLSTFSHQIDFIYQRMQRALPLMLADTKDLEQKRLVTQRFNGLASSPNGLYALIDYVNFKGEGVSTRERYNGEGWGLLQVLLLLDGKEMNLTNAFSKACKYVLNRRVHNSPQREVEEKWIAGWERRCETYKHPKEN